MTTPTTKILTLLDQQEEREKDVTAGPWNMIAAINPTAYDGDTEKPLTHDDMRFFASSRTLIPRQRQAIRLLVEALEAQPHSHRCHLNSRYPFSDNLREEWNAKGCDCWKNDILTQTLTILSDDTH